jgi:hypothetical protein
VSSRSLAFVGLIIRVELGTSVPNEGWPLYNRPFTGSFKSKLIYQVAPTVACLHGYNHIAVLVKWNFVEITSFSIGNKIIASFYSRSIVTLSLFGT